MEFKRASEIPEVSVRGTIGDDLGESFVTNSGAEIQLITPAGSALEHRPPAEVYDENEVVDPPQMTEAAPESWRAHIVAPEMLIDLPPLSFYWSPPADSGGEEVAQQTATRLGTTPEQLDTTYVDVYSIMTDSTIPYGVRRRFESMDGEVALTRVLREAQEYAADHAYAQVVAANARELLQQHLPEALPQEVTLTAADREQPGWQGYYAGRYGGHHIMVINPGREPVTPQVIAEAHTDVEAALTLAHELAHQKHAESHELTNMLVGQGPAADVYDTHDTDDVYKALDMAHAHVDAHVYAQTQNERLENGLATKVFSHLVELYAYTVEDELRDRIGAEKLPIEGTPEFLECASYYPALYHYLRSGESQLTRTEVMERVLQVDLAGLAELPAERLQEALDNPRLLLQLPSYRPVSK